MIAAVTIVVIVALLLAWLTTPGPILRGEEPFR
jgi:hypothetical protein